MSQLYFFYDLVFNILNIYFLLLDELPDMLFAINDEIIAVDPEN